MFRTVRTQVSSAMPFLKVLILFNLILVAAVGVTISTLLMLQ